MKNYKNKKECTEKNISQISVIAVVYIEMETEKSEGEKLNIINKKKKIKQKRKSHIKESH